jgi:hypothetical protein
MSLPTTAKERKTTPIARGVLDYFPDAIAAVAHLSYVGNEQHNPGEPMHWAREKSSDHADCIARHLIDRGTLDTDGMRHSTKVAWRALAMLQLEIEAEKAAEKPKPLPGVRYRSRAGGYEWFLSDDGKSVLAKDTSPYLNGWPEIVEGYQTVEEFHRQVAAGELFPA